MQLTLERVFTWTNPIFCQEIGQWVTERDYNKIQELIRQGYKLGAPQ